MRKAVVLCCFALFTSILLISGCNRQNQKADIPDIQSIYDNISYIDTLIRSEQVDSIERIHDHITGTIQTYANRAQTPEDKAILDSLISIKSVTSGFLMFCNDSQTYLELLEQDTKGLENQYRSGKIKIISYVSALLEEEQILIEIRNQLTSGYEASLHYLKNQSQLIKKLSPLSEPGIE